MSTFIIAEAGVNHNGDEAMAFELVLKAKEAGADAVKFQTFSAETLVCPGAKKAEYQEKSGIGDDQFSMLKRLEMSKDLHARLFEYCNELGIEFMSTPFDKESLDFLIGLGMKRIKIPSGEITNIPYLKYVAEKELPVIISTGMASIEEIEMAVSTIRNIRGNKAPTELTVLHCTSNYPADVNDVNLRAIHTIADAVDSPVGYSDHTLGIDVSIAAAALGCTVIEKHFTLDKKLQGPDHQASLNVDELTQMVKSIRNIEMALGSDVKAPTASELPIRDVARRSITLIRELQAGETIQEDDLMCLRPGTGIPPGELDKVIGSTLKHALPTNTTLQWSDLS